jgi:MoxR-like ATPase
VFDQRNNDFFLRQGPIFTNVLLADEINRASPRTQSALLEAMNDGQVSIDGKTIPLSEPFLVVATQNPQDFAGTRLSATQRRDTIDARRGARSRGVGAGRPRSSIARRAPA